MFNEHANWRRKCTILCVCFFFGVVNKAHAALVMVVRCCCYCRFYRRQITYENVYPSTRTPHLVRLRRSTMPRHRQARMSANEQPAQLWIHERSERKIKEKHLYLTNTNRLRSAHTYSILNWLKFHLNRNCCCCAELVVHCSLNWIYEIYDQFIYYSHLTKSTTALLDVARYPLRCRCRWHGRSHTIIIHGA